MIKTSFLTAALGSAALLGTAMTVSTPAHAPATAHADDDACDLSVVGVGELALEPDRAQVVLGAVFQAETAGEAQLRVNRVLGQIIEDVKDLDVPGTIIQTASISIQPVYDQQRNKAPKIVAYRASNSVSVQVDDVSQVGRVMDVGVSHEANQGFGVTFMLQDRAAAEREALRMAVSEARRKSDIIASELGMGELRVVRVTEQGAEPPRPTMQRGMEMRGIAMDASAPTPIEGGKITVRAQVTMDCRIRE